VSRIADRKGKKSADPVPTRFQDFSEVVRPQLDAAFRAHLTGLLGDEVPIGSGRKTDILSGGKRIRGSLLCLVASALGGALKDALSRAVAVELIQTATLIHDDVVDQHRSRRNSPALWTLEGARKAVLLGDIIFASAIRMMSELGREDGLIASRAIAEVSRGAYQEPLNPSSLLEDTAVADAWDTALYEKIIGLKTGVLFGSASRLGAVSAKASGRSLQRWYQYGLKIGEAYQIADDLHEIERCLITRSMTRSEIIALAPALLFFVRESRPDLLKVLRRQSMVLRTELPKHFETAAGIMKVEIASRLQSAISAMEDDFPDNEYGRVARRAPRDIIAMFDEARTSVSSP